MKFDDVLEFFVIILLLPIVTVASIFIVLYMNIISIFTKTDIYFKTNYAIGEFIHFLIIKIPDSIKLLFHRKR